MQINRAIVKTPCKSIVNGITSARLGKPIYEKAVEQHKNYILALEECGVKVTILEKNEQFPDSVFVEDAAVLTKECAIITNPGAESRKGEEESVEKALRLFYDNIEYIEYPGTLEGGDIMQVNNYFYIGISERTNLEGARQLTSILEKCGYTASMVKLQEYLHLKTGVSYIGDNTLIQFAQ